MINIRHPRLYEYALLHYDALVEYFQRPGTSFTINELDEINQQIGRVFEGYDFKKIVLAEPQELEVLKAGLDQQANPPDFSKLVDLYEVFAKTSSKMKDGYNAFVLFENLDISVCPYCNRNFIRNARKRRTSQFDHFYPKDRYKLLAVSFFNLIPVCKVCNHLKNNNQKQLPNPYDTRYDWNSMARFELKIKAADFYYNPKSVEIELKAKDAEVVEIVENMKDVLGLKELYDQHDDYVVELVQKKYLYSDDYLNALFKQYEGTLFRNREDLLRLVTANFVDDKDLKNRPLSKLTKDISEQLDL
ncbi:MAG: HNH endonuclease [Saprospiraceae bacterium]|nr:HNH endonuclease [Saprospiraceae bacterium]